MDQNKEPLDAITESRAARWAWRVSLIPLLGVPLFIVLSFIALYRIGSKGRTGFWLLRRGVVAMLLLSVVPYFGLYLSGYSGYFCGVYNSFYQPAHFPKHGIYRDVYLAITENIAGPIASRETWWFGHQTGEYIYYNPDGSISEEGNMLNGLREGKCTWYISGKKKAEGYYQNGKQEGNWTEWENNIKVRDGTYKNDRKDGRWIEYDEYTPAWSEGEYKNGRYEGVWISRHVNGQKIIEREYKNGKRSGRWQYWDASGNLTREETYDTDGKLISTKEYPTPTPTTSPQPTPSPTAENKSK